MAQFPAVQESGMAIFAREEVARQIVKRHGYPHAIPIIDAFGSLLDRFAHEFGITRLEAPHVAVCWYALLHLTERARIQVETGVVISGPIPLP